MRPRAQRSRFSRAGLPSVLLALALVAGGLPVASFGSATAANGLFPWQIDDDGPPGAGPIGTDFVLEEGDLVLIMQQILIAEQHAATATSLDPCGTQIGPGPNQIPAGPNFDQLSLGLRTVSGICNNLNPGNENFGAADQPFIRLTAPDFRSADVATVPPADDFNGLAFPNLGDATSYTQTTGWVEDASPRLISNLIVDATSNNPAAVAAAGGGAVAGDLNGDGTIGDHPLESCPPPVLPIDTSEERRCQAYYIANVAPDEGLSAPFNSMMTFFGQFFDHGLDLTTKTGDLVYMPLAADDPLFDLTPGAPNFMLMSRATNDVSDPANLTTPFVDQQQTYTSTPSHQVFNREYVLNGALEPVSNGRLLTGASGSGMATWDDLKLQAATLLGIQLVDEDVLNIPLIATDLYGKFIPGPVRGMPQIVLDDGSLLEGDPAANGDMGVLLPKGLAPGAGNSIPTGHAFLIDIAHHAVPGECQPVPLGPFEAQTPDLDAGPEGLFGDDNDACTYDDEMLGAHFQAGDGRVNENIALTAVHHVFHSEHNRLVAHIQDQVTTTYPHLLSDWEISGGVWNGERLFQAAKFATEMQYQHLAFEEFARKIQPFVNEFIGYDTSINSAIFAEFAHAVYRFGHSMLTETVDVYNTSTGTEHHLFLKDAFLNPPAFSNPAVGSNPDEWAGGILAGSVAQTGQQIDEFITEALRNDLVGLPLDLGATNIARGRDAGLPPLNQARREFFALTNSNPALAPYDSWMDYSFALRTPESLANFIAAYGTHTLITSHDDGSGAGTMSSRREAADIILNQPLHASYPADATDFLWGLNAYSADLGGMENVDLWVGGLAEKPEIFGGMLGTTHNFVFELQMENLQNGDRFYYLHRLAGTNLLQALEGNSFAELIERNTSASMLPADVFSVPSFTFDMNVVNMDPTDFAAPLINDPDTDYDETVLLVKEPDGTVRYPDADHALFYGTPLADDIESGDGDDTVKGNEGDDRLEGGGGNDGIVGGLGNDILTDRFGDDDLKGGPGNDAIHGGPGFDLLQGGTGHDMVVIGSDPGEILSSEGNDILIGGDSFDVIFGDSGDDWIEGGDQADFLAGDHGALTQNNPLGTDGHDVINSGGGNDDYDSEGGDDILIHATGTDGFEAGPGFDWVITQGLAGTWIDLERTAGIFPPHVEVLENRYDLVEAVSGHDGDDTIHGDSRGNGEIAPCPVPFTCSPLNIPLEGDHRLMADGIARIAGLADLLPLGATLWEDGNILLGGAGSDVIEGRGSDDIIDGDRFLQAVLDAPDPLGAMGARKQVTDARDLEADIFAGLYNPGDVMIVRSIETPAHPVHADIDVALYQNPMADFNITFLGDRWIVDHVRGCGDPAGLDICPLDGDGEPGQPEGRDTVFNVEILRFSDQDLGISAPPGIGELRVTTTPAVSAQITVNGFAADTWGLTWVDFPEGTHTVCFTDMPAMDTPPCQDVTILAGATTVLDGAYAARGWLQATTNPALPATITIDGEPANDWGVWTHLPEGEAEVCFGPVAGWDQPDFGTGLGPCQQVNILNGAPVVIQGNYVANASAVGPTGHGFLRVETTPAMSAQISVDGTPNNSWGLNWMKITPGLHEVCFSDMQGWSTPECEEITIVAGATTTVQGNYVQRGTLQVNTSPAIESTILIDGFPANDWGNWTDHAPGDYEVCFSEALIVPSCQVVTVTAGANTFVVGTWVP